MATTKTYGTAVIPGDVVNVLAGSTVDISLAFNATVGLIGNMDTANGSASTGSVEHVPDSSTAADLFGTDSELHRQTQLAYQNEVADVYAVGVAETSTTESFSSVASGTLANTPVIIPEVAPEHTITAQDTTEGVSVDIVLTYSTPSTPSSSNTINLNPVTGNWEADASSSYDISYDYGDYASAITSMASENVRYACALTESESVANSLLSDLNQRATNFDLKRGMANGQPDVANPADYSDNLDDQRLSVVMAPRGYIDDAETEEVRMCGPIAALAAGKALGDTIGNENVAGITGLRTEYTPQDAADFIDKQVMPVFEDDGIEVVKDMTTSTEQKFERIYACDVVDEVTEISHQIAKAYNQELNFSETVDGIEDDHVSALAEMSNDRPPLLNSTDGTKPYAVSAEVNDSNSNKIDVEVGIDVVDVIDQIEVDIIVGDVITNGGAS